MVFEIVVLLITSNKIVEDYIVMKCQDGMAVLTEEGLFMRFCSICLLSCHQVSSLPTELLNKSSSPFSKRKTFVHMCTHFNSLSVAGGTDR